MGSVDVLMIGIDYHTAPIEIRERFVFREETLLAKMKQLNQLEYVKETVILSTCNRTEIYLVAERVVDMRLEIDALLEKWLQLPSERFSSFLISLSGDEVVRHLFQVTAGLESMVIGETQILGQVKQAFALAQQAQWTGVLFNQLFKQAITFAKHAHKQTGIADKPVSLSYAAVKFAQEQLGDLADKRVTILGTGKMGELAARNVAAVAHQQVTIVNRSFPKAQMLAEQLDCLAVDLSQLPELLQRTDLLISTVTTTEPLITRQMLANSMAKRACRLLIIDLSLPRSIEPTAVSIEQLDLFDIDRLHLVLEQHQSSRELAAEQIDAMIGDQLSQFNNWQHIQQLAPILADLQRQASEIERQTMGSITNKLPHLTEQDRTVINKHITSVLNQTLKQPVTKLKQLAVEPNRSDAIVLFKDIFGLDIHTEAMEAYDDDH